MATLLTHTIEGDELIINRVADNGTILAEYRFRIEEDTVYWHEETVSESSEAHTIPDDVGKHIHRNLEYTDIAQVEPVKVNQVGAGKERVTFRNPVELWGEYLSQQAYATK